MSGLGILSVGAGDTKLTFDKSNPAERIRSARIVTDMLRRGYALLIEEDDGQGGKRTHRVREFREDVCEYIIADLDPEAAARTDRQDGQASEGPIEGPAPEGVETRAAEAREGAAREARNAPRRSYITRSIPADGVHGVAVARSAGG